MAGKADRSAALGRPRRRRADDAARQRRRDRPLSLQSSARRHDRDRLRLLHGARRLPALGLARAQRPAHRRRLLQAASARRASTSGSISPSSVSRSSICRRSSTRPSSRRCGQTRAGEVWLAGTKYLPVWPSRWVLPSPARSWSSISCSAIVVRHRARPRPRSAGGVSEHARALADEHCRHPAADRVAGADRRRDGRDRVPRASGICATSTSRSAC